MTSATRPSLPKKAIQASLHYVRTPCPTFLMQLQIDSYSKVKWKLS